MKLYAAPLQGFTEAPWRNLHQEVFGGIDAYYTPFVRMEKGEFRNKDVREIASENNPAPRPPPQDCQKRTASEWLFTTDL